MAVDAGATLEFVLEDAGWTEEMLARLKQAMQAAQPPEPVPQPLQGQNQQQQIPTTVVTQVPTK